MELNNDGLFEEQEKERVWRNKWPVDERISMLGFTRNTGDVCLLLRYNGNVELHTVQETPLNPRTSTMYMAWSETTRFLPSSGFVYDKIKSLIDMTGARPHKQNDPCVMLNENEWLTLYSTLLEMAENQNV